MPENKAHTSVLRAVGHHSPQMELGLYPVREIEVDGIQMGVLSDGTPYLTLRGLARMCGVDHTSLLRLATGWAEEQSKPRGIKIRELISAQGHNGEERGLLHFKFMYHLARSSPSVSFALDRLRTSP